MENQQMAMPAEMAPAGPNPEEMAIYEQMRQQISPQEFSNEMLAGASQVDPQAVAEFTQELQGLDMPPETLDALNDVVDEILANPEQYQELRATYMDQGLPEDILPEQFDPQFFAALNMAIDQMIAAPTGVQAFAQGGIAELKPIAKAIASYGRNGDTMLAHITPAEARMLRRRGGSGTINPKTGLPEFFLKKLWKAVTAPLRAVGKAVKKFAQSSIGRIVLPIALGFFLGPAAASFMGVGSAAGVAAVSGFVGSAGSTVLAGGNLKDALKAGAIGGLTAGATAGVMNGFDTAYAGPTTVGGQVDAFKGMLPGGTPAPAPVPGAGPQGIGPNQMPVPDADPLGNFMQQQDASFVARNASPGSSAYDLNMNAQNTAAANMPATGGQAGATAPAANNVLTDNVTTSAQRDAFISNSGLDKSSPTFMDQVKSTYNNNFSPSGIQEAGQEAAMSKTLAKFPGTTSTQVLNAPANSVLGKAYQAALPGMLSTYGPMAAVGLGTMAAFGGFDSKPVQGGPITQSLMTPVTQRIRQDGTQRQMYLQGMPGVQYDQYGEPTDGYSRLPTYDVPDYNSGGYGMQQGQSSMGLPSVYIPPPGTIGSRSVAQPYNNSDMYSNIVPRRYAEGGPVSDLYRSVLNRDPSVAEIDAYKRFGDTIDERERAEFREASKAELDSNAAANKAAQTATEASQKANRDKRAQEKAMRKSQGSANMYGNINAGIAALAPESFPGAPVQLDAAREAAMRTDFTGAGQDIDYARVMQEKGYRPEEVAALTGRSFGDINRRYNTALRQDAYAPMLQGQQNAMATQADILRNARGINAPVQPPGTQPPGTQPPGTQPPVTQPPGTQPPITVPPVTQPPVTQPPVTGVTNTQITDYLAANPDMTDAQIRGAMDQFGVGVDQMAAATGLPTDQVQGRYDTASNYNNQDIQGYLAANPNMTDSQIRGAMDQFGVGTAQMAAATGLPMDQIQQRYDTASNFNNQAIQDYLGANPNMTDAQIRGAMDQFGVGTAQMAAATGLPMDQVQQRYNTAGAPVQPPVAPPVTQPPVTYTNEDIQGYLAANPGMTDTQIRGAMDQFGVGVDQMASATGLPMDQVQQRYTAAAQPSSNFTDQDILSFLSANPNMTDTQIRGAMDQYGVDPARMASATGMPLEQIQQRYTAAAAPKQFLNMGGIAGLAQGGYPRRNGQINGPGTEKSDSIPAMLSDGEFVMTAKAVRGAGKGSRRAGAKQMYKLMHQLEKNSERG